MLQVPGTSKDGSPSTHGKTIRPSGPVSLIDLYSRPDRHEILYRLLSERDETTNISHKGMPDWQDHVDFVERHPYEAWYFIGSEPIGACYLTKQNEIGIFIFKAHQGCGHGPAAIKALMEKHGERRYLANINPHNERSQSVFSALGFKLSQYTYEYSGP